MLIYLAIHFWTCYLCKDNFGKVQSSAPKPSLQPTLKAL